MFSQEMSVGRYLDVWLDTVIKVSVRYSTYTSYKGYISRHIKKHLGNKLLKMLKPADVQEFIAKLSSEGKICARTICIIVRMLKSALKCAEDYELIVRNPCLKIRLPKPEEKEVEVFNNAEQTCIEKAVLESKDNRCYGILLSLYTGLRIGELCALKWEHIDFPNRCLHIKKSLNRSESIGNCPNKTVMLECEPKTRKSKRTIHLPEFIAKTFEGLKNQSNSEYVFSMKSGKFVHPRTMQALHKKLLKKAGVAYNNFHVLRHTFATRAAELNADPKTVSETLGHSSTLITLNRYTHSLKEQKQKLMNELDNYFKNKKIATI